MTQHFQKYEFQELVQPEPTGPVKEYVEPRFSQKADIAKVDSTHKSKEHFRLDQAVSSQLGIEEREKKAIEERIAKEIERRWEKTCEKAEVEGYTKGLEEGKREAFKAELPRIQERIAKLDYILQHFDQMKERIFVSNEAFLMDLISRVAGMIVLREVEIDKEYIKRVVIALLNQLGTKDDLKIYLSEADFSNLEMLKQAIEKEFGKLSNTSIEASPEIPVGGCKIETRFGVIDASVSTQIENVMKALRG